MTTYYCMACAQGNGLLAGNISTNLTGSNYQLEKFIKHTTEPDENTSIVSVLSGSDYDSYKCYYVDTMHSGSVEVDGQNRVNVVWAARRETGATWVSGEFASYTDGIKVVLADNPQKVHLFNTDSNAFVEGTCEKCGAPLIQ